MKKILYLFAALAFALTLATPALTRAENASVSADSSTNTETRTASSTRKPPIFPAVRQIMRTDLNGKLQNIKDNQQIRNNGILERNAIATSTRTDVKDAQTEGRQNMKNASSTDEHKDVRQNMRTDIFKARQQRIIKELELSLNNLKQIRTRINSRIEKSQQSGRDMSSAKSLLAIADIKILNAQSAINALAAFIPVASTTVTTSATASTTGDVDISKPRQIGSVAIQSIKDARIALNAVVRAIAHSEGGTKNDEHTATTTASTTASTTTE